MSTKLYESPDGSRLILTGQEYGVAEVTSRQGLAVGLEDMVNVHMRGYVDADDVIHDFGEKPDVSGWTIVAVCNNDEGSGCNVTLHPGVMKTSAMTYFNVTPSMVRACRPYSSNRFA